MASACIPGLRHRNLGFTLSPKLRAPEAGRNVLSRWPAGLRRRTTPAALLLLRRTRLRLQFHGQLLQAGAARQVRPALSVVLMREVSRRSLTL